MNDDLTLEKLKIVSQLQEISTNQAVMAGKLDQLSGDHKRLSDALMGDGSEGKVGIIVRLDRLEQTDKNVSFHRKTLYTGLVGLALEHFRHLFFGK